MKAIEILNRCRAADAEISRIQQRIEQRNSALYRITASPMAVSYTHLTLPTNSRV